uniref:Uncharacterized protein n=1 Tax=Peronospora matthiolae TaxID=2874970 RepID=A0AAV1TD93_9STRA
MGTTAVAVHNSVDSREVDGSCMALAASIANNCAYGLQWQGEVARLQPLPFVRHFVDTDNCCTVNADVRAHRRSRIQRLTAHLSSSALSAIFTCCDGASSVVPLPAMCGLAVVSFDTSCCLRVGDWCEACYIKVEFQDNLSYLPLQYLPKAV